MKLFFVGLEISAFHTSKDAKTTQKQKVLKNKKNSLQNYSNN